MTTVDVFDDYLDELYHTRDVAFDNEDYTTVREMNIQLSKALNVGINEIDELDDHDDTEVPFIDEEDYIIEKID